MHTYANDYSVLVDTTLASSVDDFIATQTKPKAFEKKVAELRELKQRLGTEPTSCHLER